jgi:hypothetical protein
MRVGIIGLPYAFNRAGLLLGIVLLFSLTGVVDWTIRYDFLCDEGDLFSV